MQSAGNPRPKITVIVLNWNGKQHLELCLSSLTAQTYSDYDILFVDNGSADGSLAFVEERFPAIRTLRFEQNQGITGAFNQAVATVDADYIGWLNNDTEVASDWLERLVEAMEADPRIAACDSNVVYFDKRDTIWSAGALYTWFGTSQFRLQGAPAATLQTNDEVFAAVGCAALYRKSVIDEIGALDTILHVSHEDIDWSFRARRAGYRIINVHNSFCYHKVSQTTVVGSPTYVFQGQRNVHLVFLKNAPLLMLILCLPLHLLYVMAGGVYHARIGRFGPFLRAKAAALRLLPDILARRRAQRRTARVGSGALLPLLSLAAAQSTRRLIGAQ